MSKAKGIREVAYVDVGGGGGVSHTQAASAGRGMQTKGWLDCAGGGQVVVEKNVAYVGNMRNPHGTLVIDVADPKHPKQIASISMPAGTHSHKVRVADGIMITNREVLGTHALQGETPPEGYTGGLSIYDVSKPDKPRLITNWDATDRSTMGYARGVHRFDFDGRYAYISPTMDGYVGNIAMILDLKDPAHPQEVGRWWMPGQWVGGGETPTWQKDAHKCHHPLRYGNRLYTSYWQGGFVILDIDDMSKPKHISGLDWSPPFPWPTHTALRIPFKIANRDFLVCSDEDVF
ncbi:MAG TPA: hypothetical protein VLN59_17160, partial [Burkholderiales bacterium]|nr:hypothetical protein [Burkholderiales bacterium]